MEKKNIIWWTGILNPDHSEKYGGYEYFKYSKNSWKYWCKKNDCLFVSFEKPIENDLIKFRVNWQKALFVFDELERRNINYDQICLVDSSSIIKWNTPNFFNLTNREFTALRDLDNLRWVYDSVQGYKNIFKDFKLDISKYVNSGFMIFNQKHRQLFKNFKQFYYDNLDELINLQDKVVKRGTEQTPMNYWLQMNNIDIKLDLPTSYKLTHIHRKEMFSHNWQLNEDKTPFFIKYGYIWGFGGFDKRERNKILDQTWKLVRHNYFENPTIEFLLESIGEDKHTNPATTSNKFKSDVWEFFKDFKDKVCVEFGTHKGQTTKILSYCFKKVYTINKEIQSFDNAKMLNVGIDNIKYVPFDLYSDEKLSIKNVSVFMIDAGHKYTQVVSDLDRCIDMSDIQDSYIIFDDYGLDVHEKEVKRAVDEYISANKIQVVKKIGHSSGHTFGGSLGRTLKDNEGLICRIVK